MSYHLIPRNLLFDPAPSEGGGDSNISTTSGFSFGSLGITDIKTGDAPVPDAVAQPEEPVAPITQQPPKQPDVVPAMKGKKTQKDVEDYNPLDYIDKGDTGDVDSTVIPKDGKPKKPVTDEDFLEKLGEKPEAVKTEKVVEVVKPAATARDFTGIDEAHIPAFKNMSKEAFAEIKPLYLERKQLEVKVKELDAQLKVKPKSGLPEQYYEHPDAYVLDPQYNKAQQLAQELDLEKNFYKEQLAALKEGELISDLSWDEKQGYTKSQPRKATKQDEANLIDMIQDANIKKSQVVKSIVEQKNGFKQRHQQAATSVKKAEADFFPFYEDKNGKPYQAHKSLIDQAIAALPSEYKNHPLAQLIGKSYAFVKWLDTEKSRLEKQIKTGAAVKEDQRKAGPTGSTVSGAVVPRATVTDEAFMKETGMNL